MQQFPSAVFTAMFRFGTVLEVREVTVSLFPHLGHTCTHLQTLPSPEEGQHTITIMLLWNKSDAPARLDL